MVPLRSKGNIHQHQAIELLRLKCELALIAYIVMVSALELD